MRKIENQGFETVKAGNESEQKLVVFLCISAAPVLAVNVAVRSKS